MSRRPSQFLIFSRIGPIGASLSRNPSGAKPTVFPDKYHELKPRMPEVDDLKLVLRTTIIEWVRAYLNALWSMISFILPVLAYSCISEWQGGRGQVPWKRLSEDSEYNIYSRHRMPEDINSITEPTAWTREVAVAWYNRIIASQLPAAPAEAQVQFRSVLTEKGELVATYTSLCTRRHAKSTLTWTPEEKLYAAYVDQQGTDPDLARAWRGLPLARTEGVYVPLSDVIVQELGVLTSEHIDLQKIAVLINKMENFGPAHVSFIAFQTT